jgi:hypothetical protein
MCKILMCKILMCKMLFLIVSLTRSQ